MATTEIIIALFSFASGGAAVHFGERPLAKYFIDTLVLRSANIRNVLVTNSTIDAVLVERNNISMDDALAEAFLKRLGSDRT